MVPCDFGFGLLHLHSVLSSLQYRASHVMQPMISSARHGLPHVGQKVCSGSYFLFSAILFPFLPADLAQGPLHYRVITWKESVRCVRQQRDVCVHTLPRGTPKIKNPCGNPQGCAMGEVQRSHVYCVTRF
jgi:hypothetical protein